MEAQGRSKRLKWDLMPPLCCNRSRTRSLGGNNNVDLVYDKADNESASGSRKWKEGQLTEDN